MSTIYDAVVVGGSFAGLSAAMQLARARRTVLMLDTGQPRNRFATASHGFLGLDGRSPQVIMEIGRAQLLAYPNFEFRQAEATGAAAEDGAFTVSLAGGSVVRAERLILATGLTDHLPDVPGMVELWGKGVNQCPYCHGYEVGGRRLAVFGIGPTSVHHTMVVAGWSDDTTLLTHGGDWLTPEHRAALAARNIKIDETPLRRLIPDGPDLKAVEFTDGRVVPYGAMFTGTRWSFASPLGEMLGCETEDTPFGPILKVDARKETTISGIYAAGDISNPAPNATLASASGLTAGVSAHQSLLGLTFPLPPAK